MFNRTFDYLKWLSERNGEKMFWVNERETWQKVFNRRLFFARRWSHRFAVFILVHVRRQTTISDQAVEIKWKRQQQQQQHLKQKISFRRRQKRHVRTLSDDDELVSLTRSAQNNLQLEQTKITLTEFESSKKSGEREQNESKRSKSDESVSARFARQKR